MLDRLYAYYFVQTRSYAVLCVAAFLLFLGYMSLMVCVFARAERAALGEGICLTILLLVGGPLGAAWMGRRRVTRRTDTP